MSEKKILRKELLNARNALKKEEISRMSHRILENIKNLPEWKQAENVYTYVSFESEVNTIFFIKECFKESKKVAVPKVLEKGNMEFFYISSLEELKPGMWGILEPEGKEEQQAMPFLVKEGMVKPFLMIPGLGFDREFHRLGYGGGFYDKYLKKYGVNNFLKVAVAFPMQIKKAIPYEEHDIFMDMIITPEQIEISKNREIF